MKKITIKIDPAKCKGCLLCVGVCPKRVLEVSDRINKRGERYVTVKHPEKCTGCGMCVMMCPDCGITISEENV